MLLAFTKMHSAGNDYIYINCLDSVPDNLPKLSVSLSKRHTSVGADGIVAICRSDVADAKMRMFNADGSEGKMCGNAVACVGKYLYDNGICIKEKTAVETLGGIKYLKLSVRDGKVSEVTVDMGIAETAPENIPVLSDVPIVGGKLDVLDKTYEVTCISMGNPHAVTFTDNIAELDLAKIGPYFENHRIFPDRVNAEFVELIDRKTVRMRVWERGSGETYACGTGACASVFASVLHGFCDRNADITVNVRGGILKARVLDDDRILMTAKPEKVFDGTIEI